MGIMISEFSETRTLKFAYFVKNRVGYGSPYRWYGFIEILHYTKEYTILD